MKEGQEHIYYLIGDSIESLKRSPQLEGFTKRGIEVVLMTDSVDDFWVNVVPEYKEKELKSVTRAGIELDAIKEDAKAEDAEEKAQEKEDINLLIAQVKLTLGDKIADAVVSKKLTSSPVCLAVKDGAMDIRMERFLIDQRQLHSASAKILEINAEHPVITKLSHDLQQGVTAEIEDTIHLLFDQACIVEGQAITDPGAFSQRLSSVLEKALLAA